MEGKEVRFGIGSSTLTAVVTSNTATGSNNSMDDSYTSLGGMVLLMNMLLGELVFGGLGTGLYSMVMAAAIAVFLAGLMVGRTPEYLGKKIGPAENKMIMLYALAAPLVVLPLTRDRGEHQSWDCPGSRSTPARMVLQGFSSPILPASPTMAKALPV